MSTNETGPVLTKEEALIAAEGFLKVFPEMRERMTPQEVAERLPYLRLGLAEGFFRCGVDARKAGGAA